ncbi:hypothetical protein EON77_07065 [bacterium]|nr:MAG: hypothetical protein EON77_07065 [bacterium]
MPPGILSTWREVASRVPMTTGDGFAQALYWARFVAFPVLGLILLLLIQVRSGRGLKYALGEEAVLTDGDDHLRRDDD